MDNNRITKVAQKSPKVAQKLKNGFVLVENHISMPVVIASIKRNVPLFMKRLKKNVIIVHQEKKELHEMTKEELEKVLLIEQIHTERHKRSKSPENTGNGTVGDVAGAVGNSNIVGNNNNNQFNIQLFLNEDCKNALSIQDFAKQLTVTMEELSLLKDSEPKGIEEIIRNNLMKYALTERPMHNHEKKWYVKDKNDGWEDDKADTIVKSVKQEYLRNQDQFLLIITRTGSLMIKKEKLMQKLWPAMSEPSERTTNKY